MLKFDNTHIFTGYLKQLLGSVNIPTCKIYTQAFANYAKTNKREDPRLIESFDSISTDVPSLRINYLKNNEFYYYFMPGNKLKNNAARANATWKQSSSFRFDPNVSKACFTKTLYSPGASYDTHTHEYLGDYLRFLRDYYDIDLMSLYNCFNNKIRNNIYFDSSAKSIQDNSDQVIPIVHFNSRESDYHIYAVPVKLFSNYTIAIDCAQPIEMFCGFYDTALDTKKSSIDLFRQTYKKYNNCYFNQPILYDKLDVSKWPSTTIDGKLITPSASKATRWSIAEAEQNLKLIIKIPASCRSSVVILEGDYRAHNDFKYSVKPGLEAEEWTYASNHCVVNCVPIDDTLTLNDGPFKPISKLQLLAFNAGESFPFATRLIEYLSGNVITPVDPIYDNIKRAQRVMYDNGYSFQIEGLWEDKMQKLVYDYIVNSGPITVATSNENNKKTEKMLNGHSGENPTRYGYNKLQGRVSKSELYDVLGYVDKDAEKWYASWTIHNGKPKIKNSIQNIDIYNKLYDL